MDSDGCRDSTEDDDDDGDGVADLQDSCPSGIIGWNSNSVTDYDLDGCQVKITMMILIIFLMIVTNVH